jgi:hypothetical protein
LSSSKAAITLRRRGGALIPGFWRQHVALKHAAALWKRSPASCLDPCPQPDANISAKNNLSQPDWNRHQNRR